MHLSSRFPVAVQILIILAWVPDEVKVTSEILAKSVNTNPVLIRRIMGYLKRGELIIIPTGIGGANLTKKPTEITLLDVYRAVELTEENQLFGLHDSPNPHCPIGKEINSVLKIHLDNAREALENRLAQVNIAELVESFPPFDREILKYLALKGE
ncbi:MAG: Rrf2 family transcriptional regulator [Desulfitobacterium sp.]|nr:Rrf2 family transcriptional regulator [Desulfitobacterium sp.]